jgi:hypothetical protein
VWAALKHPNIVEFKGYVIGIAEYPAMVSKVRSVARLSILFRICNYVD